MQILCLKSWKLFKNWPTVCFHPVYFLFEIVIFKEWVYHKSSSCSLKYDKWNENMSPVEADMLFEITLDWLGFPFSFQIKFQVSAEQAPLSLYIFIIFSPLFVGITYLLLNTFIDWHKAGYSSINWLSNSSSLFTDFSDKWFLRSLSLELQLVGVVTLRSQGVELLIDIIEYFLLIFV